jgi:hypothetical protein
VPELSITEVQNASFVLRVEQPFTSVAATANGPSDFDRAINHGYFFILFRYFLSSFPVPKMFLCQTARQMCLYS